MALLMVLNASAQEINKLSKKENWVLLFNGKDFDGWRQCNGTEMPANWIIEDNSMKVLLGDIMSYAAAFIGITASFICAFDVF